MTVAPRDDNLPANADEFSDGLEDFGMEDAVIPRIKILHQDGEFEDSLSKRTFVKMEAIFLGMIRQRTLWHPNMDDDDAAPMCKSQDFSSGWPNMSEDQPKIKRFPWDKSGFDPADYPEDEDGMIGPLPCERCALQKWGSHPDGKKPYCSELFTMPLLYREYTGEDDNDDEFLLAVIAFQKTALKPLKAYLSDFKRSKTATYTAVTLVGLDQNSRGGNKFSVPNFRNLGKSDSAEWRGYSQSYNNLRVFLTEPPRPREDEDSGTVTTESSKATTEPEAPKEKKAKKDKSKPKDVDSASSKAEDQSSEPKSNADDDDELPF